MILPQEMLYVTKMLKELKGIYNPTIRERMERGLVSSLIGTKARFGWGLNKKKLHH